MASLFLPTRNPSFFLPGPSVLVKFSLSLVFAISEVEIPRLRETPLVLTNLKIVLVFDGAPNEPEIRSRRSRTVDIVRN